MKTNLSLLFLGIMVLVAGLAGCSRVAPDSSVAYFPHNDGYSWEYVMTSSPSTLETNITIRFNGTTRISSTLEVQNWEVNLIGYTSTSYIKVQNDGVYSYGGTSLTSETGSLILRLPPSVGQTWSAGGGSYEVLGRENVTVPAGTFDCYKVRGSSSGGYSDNWWGAWAGLAKGYSVYGSTNTSTVLKSKNF